MGLAAGTRLGPYQVVSALGAGGMGEVYRARDTRLQRDVAVKILPNSLMQDADRLRRFEQEARSVAALNHPNLLTVFDVGTLPVEEGGAVAAPFLVSELLHGATLRERLSEGALPQRKALDYAIQIARGLAATHEHGIVHRDLKPENIFVTSDGRVKILDFGLAKLTEGSAAGGGETDATLQSATLAGVILGTVGYMSPEQVRGTAADARSDIFSFGAVMYEMLAGRRAFHGKTAADVMSAILKEEPPEITATTHEIAPALDRIVHHCMEKDPQQRFQSAGDIAFQLSELSGVSTSSPLRAVAATSSSRVIRPWILGITGAASLFALLAVTWFLARSTAHPQPGRFVQITFQQGQVDSALFLPDGQSIVCASKWGSESRLGLYTGRTDSQGLRPLGVAADSVASVSAAAELLIIQNMKGIGPGYVQVGTLARVPLGGGAPRPVMDSVQYADWAPGGKDFAVVRFLPASHVYRLEYPVGKVLYETGGWISHPRFSRDGKRVVFLDHPIFGDDQGVVAVVDLQGQRKQLSDSFSSAQGLAWSPKGDEIWFSADTEGVYRSLYATTLYGRVRPLLAAPGTIDIQDALPDGRVLVNAVSVRRILMVITPDHPQGRDFSWMDWPYGMRFSPDSKQILFGDQHSGKMYGTFLRNLDGSSAVRLGDGDPEDLSPDGKWAVSRLPTAPRQIVLLPTGAGEPQPLAHSGLNYIRVRWLTNDRLIVEGNEPGHGVRTYLTDLKGIGKPITPEGVRALAATPDGKCVLTSSDAGYQLLPLDGSAPQSLPQLQDGDRPLDFSDDGAAIFVRRGGNDGAAEIWRIERAGGKRTLLRTLTRSEGAAITGGMMVAVSRDGKNFAYNYGLSISTEYIVEGLH